MRRKGPILKRWTEQAALTATNKRMYRIRQLYQEIAELWGDQDEWIVRRADEFNVEAEDFRLDIVIARQELAEERERIAAEDNAGVAQ